MAPTKSQRHYRISMATLLLPSGGSATRFRGIFKELLPIDRQGTTVIENAIQTARRYFTIDAITVITNAEKEKHHRRILDHYEITYIRQMRSELWGAIQDGLVDDDMVLLLPDTVIQLYRPQKIELSHPFILGTFATEEPWRFSTVENGVIHTKKPHGIFAWGALYWSKEVSAYLDTLNVSHYDEAFNAVLQQFPHSTFPIKEYFDLGDVAHYIDYIRYEI
jgi:hypothetical protein